MKSEKIVFKSLLPSNIFTEEAKVQLQRQSDYEGKVIIIGAGVAGLYAGCLLKEQGIDFKILEASDRLGGRIGKEEGFADFPIDTGAEWLHGDISIMTDLVSLSETEIFLDSSEPVYWHRGELKKELPKELADILGHIEEASEDVSFQDYFFSLGGEVEDLAHVAALAGDVGASSDKISAQWEARGYDFLTYGEEDYKFKQTYYDFIEEHIIAKVANDVQINTVVTEVNYSGAIVGLKDQNGKEYDADKVIVTVPITVLKAGDIQFVPDLSPLKKLSFQQLGMEACMKVFLKFSEPFVDANIVGGKICPAYALTSHQRDTKELVLMAFLMGEQAATLSAMEEEDVVQLLLEELDSMLDGKASQYYLDCFIKDWTKHPFVRGGYSYPLVGSNPRTRERTARPVDQKIFFAGEATNYNGHHQTVQGAIETAYREVLNILTVVQRERNII